MERLHVYNMKIYFVSSVWTLLDFLWACARRQAPDRSGKSVPLEPSDRPAVDRPIDNHGQPRHFPPFYNISSCFNVTKTVSTENKPALAIGEALCGARRRHAAKKLPPSASHVHEAMAHLLRDVLFSRNQPSPGSNQHPPPHPAPHPRQARSDPAASAVPGGPARFQNPRVVFTSSAHGSNGGRQVISPEKACLLVCNILALNNLLQTLVSEQNILLQCLLPCTGVSNVVNKNVLSLCNNLCMI
jgi:hypothetical protein